MAFIALAAIAAGGIGCGGGSSSCAANVAAEWFLTENGAQVSCVPGDEVHINVTNLTTSFVCSDMAGTTATVAGGVSHAISLSLFDATNTLLSQTETRSVFVPCGTITDIGLVEFSLTP